MNLIKYEFKSDNNRWVKGELTGIRNSNQFLYKAKGEDHYCAIDDIRIVSSEHNLENSKKVTEYETSQNEWVPVVIKNKKGSFYSVQLEGETGITQLAREKEIREIYAL